MIFLKLPPLKIDAIRATSQTAIGKINKKLNFQK